MQYSPPGNPELFDVLFDAGADRISMSLEIWNEKLARKIMLGEMEFRGRQQHMDALKYVALKHGKGKACSNFIIGLESVYIILEGVDFLASSEIVPIVSI